MSVASCVLRVVASCECCELRVVASCALRMLRAANVASCELRVAMGCELLRAVSVANVVSCCELRVAMGCECCELRVARCEGWECYELLQAASCERCECCELRAVRCELLRAANVASRELLSHTTYSY